MKLKHDSRVVHRIICNICTIKWTSNTEQ